MKRFKQSHDNMRKENLQEIEEVITDESIAYGVQPEEIKEDKEGLMTMYNIEKNMVWFIQTMKQFLRIL